ncbi:MAG: 30S ribosome-binding factor RbfA [Clostridia bacterium]|nr:30S ribosome-binding factor RbfA [Clostridia bacterium]MBR6966704.1 30S ribosome-binding factor RbfA [Clostridia bacterium]
MNSYQRTDRISEEIRREVDAIIREELGDPRIGGTFSITRAEVTGDLRYAKIYVSVLEDERRDELMEALKSAKGFIRRAIGKRMIIRYSPELIFISDKNIEYGVHIAKVLADTIRAEEHTDGKGETES